MGNEGLVITGFSSDATIALKEASRVTIATTDMKGTFLTAESSGPTVITYDVERELRIIEQAAKVRTLQKQWYKSIKDEKRDYDVLAESKAAEKELDVLLDEYNSPQERML